MTDLFERAAFEGKNVLITGGLGFIGSNLAIRLVGLGARITLLDAMIEGHGGNYFNIEPVKDSVEVVIADIRNRNFMFDIVRDRDFIFHLAGQNDHVLSLTDPFPDIDINIKGSAVLLFACRNCNPGVKLVYTGTRGEYGSVKKLPADEESTINPRGIYELSSLTAQKMFKIYNDNHGIRSVTLRLTNIYGTRAQMRHDRFGVVNWFIRQAIDGSTIRVFGDGSILRDFLFAEDTVEAILAVAARDDTCGQLFNVGGDVPISFRELAETIVRVAGSGRWELTPFSSERAALEPGDFYSNISKIRRIVGWQPFTSLESGIEKTVKYYRKFKEYYW